jgi:phage baseplate assembly protein W
MALANPRLGIAVNLPTGATYDILLVDTPAGFPQSKIEFKLNDTPRKVTGIQKVAQTFLKVLLTTQGSDVLNVGLGTRFPEYTINANRTGVDSALYSILITEIRNAEGQTKSILNTLDADDAGQLQEISILGIDILKERIVMYIKLLTVAGALAQVAVPFPQLDMKLSDA